MALIPALLGLVLHLQTHPVPRPAETAASIALGLAVRLNFGPEQLAPALAGGKRRWIEAYLQTHDAGRAKALSGFWAYSRPVNPPTVTARLRWLEEENLSFLAPSGSSLPVPSK